MSAVTAIPSDHPVSEDLRRVAVKSWKAPIIFGIFAALFTLLPLFGPLGMAQAVCAMRICVALALLVLAHRMAGPSRDAIALPQEG